MSEDQREIVLFSVDANGASKVTEGDFSCGFDAQIAGIESQLEKAQETLVELQRMKLQLEAARRENEEKQKKEQEKITAAQLKEENNNLRSDLKHYQSEIASLKRVIGLLKNDLVTSTELLQTKVSNSLKILEDASQSLDADSAALNKRFQEQAGVDLNEELQSRKSGSSAITPNRFLKVPANIEATHPDPVKVSGLETTTGLAAPATQTPEPAKEATVSTPVVSAETAKTEAPTTPPPTAPTAASPSPTASAETQIAPPAQDDSLFKAELEEYKKILAELESLGGSSASSNPPVPASTLTPTPATATPAPAASAAASGDPAGASPTGDFKTFWDQKQQGVATVSPAGVEPTKSAKTRRFLFIFKVRSKEEKEALKKAREEEKAAKKAAKVAEKTEQHEEKTGGTTAGLAVKAAVMVVCLLGGMAYYRISNADKLREVYLTQAQEIVQAPVDNASNVPDGFSKEPQEVRYKEAFADVPFDQTTWDTFLDSDFALSLEYPKNTSYRVKLVGGNNVWFLRKNGFLMKIEKIDTGLSLEEYIKSLNLQIKYNEEKTTFKGQSTVHLVQAEYLSVRGNYYIVRVGDARIYKIWYATFTSMDDPNDARRVEKMLDSITFYDRNGKKLPADTTVGNATSATGTKKSTTNK